MISASAFSQSYSLTSTEKQIASTNAVVAPFATPGDYKVAMAPGLRMRNAGRTLTILGGAMFIGGIIVFSGADENYYTTVQTNNGSYNEGDPQAALGILMIAGGVGMTVPGIILWTKGAKKYKRHLEHQDDKTVSFDFKGNAVALSYRF